MDGIIRDSTSNYNYPVGFGYITIPNGVDRDLYIETCYRKERVAIQLDDGGGVRMDCYVGKTAMQNIIFPDKFDELGSAVVFITPQFYNIPIIIDVVSKADETQLLQERSFKKTVHTKTASVSVEGRGKTGELFINVESLLENEGNIFITLKGKNNTAKFDVKCFGDINVYSEGETVLKALKTIDIQKIRVEGTEQKISAEMILSDDGFEVRDSFENTIISNSDGEINIYPKTKLKVFEGKEPVPLGTVLQTELNKLKDRFDQFSNTYQNTPVVPGDGGAAGQTAVKAAMKLVDTEDFTNINSTKTFTD